MAASGWEDVARRAGRTRADYRHESERPGGAGLPRRREAAFKIAASMPVRAIAFLLALVLSWSAFAGHAQAAPAVAADAPQPMELWTAASPDRLPEFPLDPQPLDDAPAQTHAESSSELPALIPAGAAAPLPAHRTVHPRPRATPARAAPYLDGLQRPPCDRLA